MKISIITVCLNSTRTVEDTVESVLSQDHPDVVRRSSHHIYVVMIFGFIENDVSQRVLG